MFYSNRISAFYIAAPCGAFRIPVILIVIIASLIALPG
ncbi:hypothetical protein [Aeromonas phage Akh-2]|nr:hypothetical protein [Aeromonas phage Akh-2]